MDPKEKKILEEKLKDFMKDIIPVELLPYLPCLTRFDRDEIQASQNNHGSVRASFVLVDRLKRRRDGFQQFVQALRECGSQHIALMLDPDCRYTCQGSAQARLQEDGEQVCCGKTSTTDVIVSRGGTADRREGIRSVSPLSPCRTAIIGPDQLISTIPFRVYSQLALLLARNRIEIASRLFDLTLEEAMALQDIANHTNSLRRSVDMVFELMSERHVTLGQLVEVLREIHRFDAISVLTEAGYPDCTLDECSDQEAVGSEEE